MSRSLSLVTAVVVVALGVIAILLGNSLVPARAEAIQKETYAPWLIVWSMILITALCAGALAAFLLIGAKGTGGKR
jgi:hypothetical protein